MKTLYFDCFAGISGDMTLGALVDLGVPEHHLLSELAKLPMADEFEVRIEKALKMGISGTKVNVILKHGDHDHGHKNEDLPEGEHGHEHGSDHEHGHDHDHSHEHDHDHGQEHGHEHNHEHEHSYDNAHTHVHGVQAEPETPHSHEHRTLAVIERMIKNSGLNDAIKKMSMKIFMEVAKAEGKIHNKPVEEVHFHEVGAVDSIVDIIGTAICLDYLKPDRILCSRVELGGGFVKCAHGLFPVPAPATAEILTGVPVHLGRVQSETTTPTGAAILKATVDEFVDSPDFTPSGIAYGLGTKDFAIPNVLRVFLVETETIQRETLYMAETNLDDMNPEIFSFLEERLFKAGARDVYKTPVIMKKGRPAIVLSVLCVEKHLETMESIIFEETTSIGVRSYPVKRKALKRTLEQIMTPYGHVTVKKSGDGKKVFNIKPEYEDCRHIAIAHGVPLKTVYADIQKYIGEITDES